MESLSSRFESGPALDVMVDVDCGVDESLRVSFWAFSVGYKISVSALSGRGQPA